MAQEYSKRKATKFQKQIVVNELAGYTLEIIQNEKYFPIIVQKAMNPEITHIVLEAAGKINDANRERVDGKGSRTPAEAYSYRIQKQTEAIELLNKLLDRIETIEIAFHLKRKKAFTWTRKTLNAIEEIKSWRASETKRLKDLGK